MVGRERNKSCVLEGIAWDSTVDSFYILSPYRLWSLKKNRGQSKTMQGSSVCVCVCVCVSWFSRLGWPLKWIGGITASGCSELCTLTGNTSTRMGGGQETQSLKLKMFCEIIVASASC